MTETARILPLRLADSPNRVQIVCRCVAPVVETFYGFRQCAGCHRPFGDDLPKAVTAA